MTKADLARKLQEEMGITQKEATVDVEALLDLMKTTLESGEQVKIPGFGVFEVKQKDARRGRNPQNGDTITIGARKIITFKTSSVLKSKINKEAA